MRIKKHVALSCMVIIFTILAICMNYLMDDKTKRSQMRNSEEICINEVCSDYFPTSFSESQTASDWIELYNASNRSINLGEYYLSDNKENLFKCKLPQIELAPGCYYVIHSETEEMSAEKERLNFRISAQGETLYLSGLEGVIDIVSIPKMNTNTTWSRLTDAGKDWGNTELTYGFTNNQAEQILEKIQAPNFSVESGFYDDEFELELKVSSDSKIYYTLDGSEPSEDSILYDKPILVKDVTEEPNIYSAREDFNSLHEGRAVDLVEKITIIRAVAIDVDGKKSDIVTNSYLIGRGNNKAYSEMCTVSLVTDPDNLFDFNEGIYVLGKGYDGLTANYQVRGKKSERPASIEIFNENGELIFDREIGIRIHGHTTREAAQKSFSVYAREMYDGKDTIDGLFGENTDVHKFMIYSNRDGTKLRDVLISKMVMDRDMSAQMFKYCNVFLDGEYWGVYLLAEVYDEYYFKNHYGIRKDNIQICESASPPDVIEYLNTILDKSDVEVYEKLCQMIDVQSFIDYYATMLYLNNSDWLFYNAICYRSIKTGIEKNEDGKWRWGVWDSEATMREPSVDTFHAGNIFSWEDDLLAQTLMEHEEFRKQFVTTYMDLYNNLWQEDNILQVIDGMENSIACSYAMHSERFFMEGESDEYYYNLKNFFADRKKYALKHVKDEFELSSNPSWIVILSNKADAASFRVNTTVINMPETWWQGLYFPDYPIEIKIEEVNGNNAFLGWYTENGELLSTDKTITLNLKEGTNTICPKFAEN